MKIEIGGGIYPKGDDYINVDSLPLEARKNQDPAMNVIHNLNCIPWPFDDEVADEVYTSHCVEHMQDYNNFMREIARICKIGAKVEIRCPDAIGEMAMCPGHTHVISINVMRHSDNVFPYSTWTNTKRRLRLQEIIPGCDDYWFVLARKNPLFATWSDMDILTWLPRTRHENRFCFIVEETEEELRAKE